MRFHALTALLFTLLTASLPGQQAATDVVVTDRVLVQRCILEGPSTRMIAVGAPGGFNYAFDALHCAPAYAWSGGFIDFKGELRGRGGGRCNILGVKQPFATDRIPLRIGKADALPESIRFHGYRRDAATGEPTFLFDVDGVSVEQKITSPKPGKVTIALSFPGGDKNDRFYLIDPTPHLQIKMSEGLRWSGPGVIAIPAAVKDARLTIHLKSTDKNFVREVEQLTGEEIYRNFCSACHSIDGTKLIGPTFKESLGREQTVTRNGKAETLTVDDAYLRESIMKPQAAIVKGYELVPMADFSAVLTPEQIDSLIDFLRELK